MATFWPKHGPTGLNFDDFFDYFGFGLELYRAMLTEPYGAVQNCAGPHLRARAELADRCVELA